MITPNPRTPEGMAVLQLHDRLAELEEDKGEWPGADAVTIISDWLARFDIPTASEPAFTRIPPRPPGQAWVLRRWDRHQDTVGLFTDEDAALASLAHHVRTSWANLLGDGDVPNNPPADDRPAVDLYYGPEHDNRPDEGYSLYADTISGVRRERIVPLDFRFPEAGACARAHRDAVFYPGTHGDLPCVSVDDILVFAYLDHELGAFRVSIHLDSAPEHLVRPDGTVPLRVVVEDTVVLDDSGEAGAPQPPLLDTLLSAADDGQREAIRAAALAAGVLWRCPVCQWDNPEAATCCEGPGPCRKPKPAAEQTAA
ncbi:hypothetical protein J7E87_30220 [Streptomyces sp. ISL-1]|uniref:hypothetical protein n=1 Tax=Streptomyces sp. ISL-1 TaxID=2817657 RepID=UPI001BE8279D|nr:hypothetical protein [Streptomyces sp. ISL-1]MBT2393574.1 hypothetical protein [Streptomyces sp. ISL-1]